MCCDLFRCACCSGLSPQGFFQAGGELSADQGNSYTLIIRLSLEKLFEVVGDVLSFPRFLVFLSKNNAIFFYATLGRRKTGGGSICCHAFYVKLNKGISKNPTFSSG